MKLFGVKGGERNKDECVEVKKEGKRGIRKRDWVSHIFGALILRDNKR